MNSSSKPVSLWAYAAATLTAFCWSGNWIVGRGLHEVMSPIAIAQWRWIVAAAVVLPFAGATLWRQRAIVREELPRLAVIAAIGVIVFNTLVYWGLHTTTAINGAVFNSSQPIFVIIIGWIWFSQKSKLREVVGVTVSIAGVLTIITRGELEALLELRFGYGDLIILVAMLSWSLYSVLIKAWPTKLGHFTFLAAMIVIGLPMMAPLYIADVAVNGLTVVNVNIVIGIVWLGIAGSIVAYLCWNYAVRQAGAARASIFVHLIPVFTALQAVILLGERVHLFHIAGIGLILSGIYVATAEQPIWRLARR